MISIKKLHARANARPQQPSWGRTTMEPMNQPGDTACTTRKPITAAEDYNSFQDPNLAANMRKPNVKQNLVQAGLMYKDGNHLPTREEKIQLDRSARLDKQSYQRCENVYRRMNKRLERMKADLDANKRLFNPKAAESCQYCGCTKLTEVNSTFANDGYSVKCLACSRTSKHSDTSRGKSIATASLTVPRLPALRPRPLATLPQNFVPLKAKLPLPRGPMRPKRMPLQTIKHEVPEYISYKYEAAATEAITAPPPSPFPDCNVEVKPTPGLIDGKLEELLQAEEKRLKEMYDKVSKREEDLDSKKVVQQPLENPEQLVMIAGKEDQLHACCKRYMTLATAVDTIEAISSEKLGSPKTSRSTLNSFPVSLKEKDLHEIEDIEKVVCQEMQVSKVHLTKRAAKKDEKKSSISLAPSAAPLAAPCSVSPVENEKASEPKLISMDDDSTALVPCSPTKLEPSDKDDIKQLDNGDVQQLDNGDVQQLDNGDIQQLPDMTPATPAPTRSTTPALSPPSRPATPVEPTTAQPTTLDVMQMRPIVLTPVRPASPRPILPSIRRASKPKFPSKLTPIRPKPDENLDGIQCTGTNPLSSRTTKAPTPFPFNRTPRLKKLTPLNLSTNKSSTFNSKKKSQGLSVKFTSPPADMKTRPPLIITATGPRPTLPCIKKTPRSNEQSKLITLEFPINTPSPINCQGVPAGIHSTGMLRPAGLRPVTRRPSMPSTLQETTTNDGSPRKSVSFEPEKVPQSDKGDKVAPDDEAVDNTDSDTTGENQQLVDGASEQVHVATGKQDDSSSISSDVPDNSSLNGETTSMKDEVQTVEKNVNETFNGPNMTVEKEGTPDAPQTAGLLTASTSNNAVDCTSPTPGLTTEQDEEPMDQSLQKVDKEPNPPIVPPLPINSSTDDLQGGALENHQQQRGSLQRSYSQELNVVAEQVATTAIRAADEDDC